MEFLLQFDSDGGGEEKRLRERKKLKIWRKKIVKILKAKKISLKFI